MSRRATLLLVAALVLVVAVWAIGYRGGDEAGPGEREAGRVAVETRPAERRSIDDIREFSGTLEASATLTVAPKIGGQIASIAADIGDDVESGDTLIRLDDEEYRQALAEAEAQLEVAQAQYEQARSDARTAERTLARVRSLNDKGIAATAELDSAEAEASNARATATVARANIAQARAQVQTARIRLGYTEIRAQWPDDERPRQIGERMVEPGDTVAANTPLLRIVAVRPLTAVIQVPEALYPTLAVGQPAQLRIAGAETAAFDAEIARIAPVFDPETRRARVELTVPNAQGRLAPGMFVQVGLVAQRLTSALVVPRAALVRRGGDTGVFVVDSAAGVAHFVPVDVAFTQGDQAALRAPDTLEGPLVTLGQAQLEDGIEVAVDDDAARTTASERDGA
ncbi:efflux RND transporter periplasmic adaptor subunit [Salinisphaera sp.]|uniref:efflux RND transporter periplasmic adaptor subunit n=1 Tax=Salinisphaera sp. TaxID=1914330 RepID=UPI000C49262A|nr:efflux RND transporter periplasmic adaptor subunit [Salinisphaera sp.]MBS63587.1 efflux transporter periplasmic adaptor subunit [Salinisphaera sp.]